MSDLRLDNGTLLPRDAPSEVPARGFLQSHGPALVAQGYPVVPIKLGTKRPTQKGWQNIDYNSKDLHRKFHGFGVGVKTGQVKAVDIDCTDREVVTRMIEWCEQNVGPTLVRIGRAPRAILIYRTSMPRPKSRSHAYRTPDGKPQQVEILGQGQQFVAYALHPETGQPYYWPKRDLTDMPLEELTEMSWEQGRAALDYFESLARENGWTQIKHTGASEDGGDHKPGKDPHAAPWLLKAALDVIPTPSDFDNWNPIAMALFCATDGSEEGFALFDHWSRRGDNYGGTRDRWESLERSPPTRIGAGKVIHKANEADSSWRQRAEAARDLTDPGWREREKAEKDEQRRRSLERLQWGITKGGEDEGTDDDLVPPPTPLAVISLDTLHGLPVPDHRWIVEGLIPDRTVSDLGGDGGTGKSLLALQLAVAMATGGEWLGLKVAKGPVLYFSAEDEKDEIHRRIAAIAVSNAVGLDALSDLYLIDQTTALSTALAVAAEHQQLTMTPLSDQLCDTVAVLHPKLVILDTRADVYAANENDRGQVRSFVQHLRHLCLKQDLAVLMLSHPSRTGMTDGSGQSGSTGWNNSVRSRLYLERLKPPSDPDKRVLTPKKANRGPMSLPITLRYQHGAFRREGPVIVEQQDWKAQNQRDEAHFLKLLREVNGQGMHVHHASGPYYAPRIFHERDPTIDRQRWRAAMNRLFQQNRVAVAGFGMPSRRTTQIVEVVP